MLVLGRPWSKRPLVMGYILISHVGCSDRLCASLAWSTTCHDKFFNADQVLAIRSRLTTYNYLAYLATCRQERAPTPSQRTTYVRTCRFSSTKILSSFMALGTPMQMQTPVSTTLQRRRFSRSVSKLNTENDDADIDENDGGEDRPRKCNATRFGAFTAARRSLANVLCLPTGGRVIVDFEGT